MQYITVRRAVMYEDPVTMPMSIAVSKSHVVQTLWSILIELTHAIHAQGLECQSVVHMCMKCTPLLSYSDMHMRSLYD